MIRSILALAVLAPAGAVALATTDASVTAGSPLAQDGDWIQIFDGKTLDGWTQRNGTATYEVVDGAIVGTTSKGSEGFNGYPKAVAGDALTQRQFNHRSQRNALLGNGKHCGDGTRISVHFG